MRIVEFENGKFGIRKGNFIEVFLGLCDYLDVVYDRFWHYEGYVKEYCLFDSFYEAEKRLSIYKKNKLIFKKNKIKKVY